MKPINHAFNSVWWARGALTGNWDDQDIKKAAAAVLKAYPEYGVSFNDPELVTAYELLAERDLIEELANMKKGR